MRTYHEFFAGGGMVRAGLGSSWLCRFANDIDPVKAEIYRNNWGEDSLHLGDVKNVTVDELNGQVDLSWASFPCQDLSLAGGGAGLVGSRSSAFRAYWELVKTQEQIGMAPKIVVLENVMGAVTSHGGKDFASLCSAFADAGYTFGAFALDAAHFVPQSRRRLFLIGVRYDQDIPDELLSAEPNLSIHPAPIVKAQGNLDHRLKERWVWWNVGKLPRKKFNLENFIQNDDESTWHSREQTNRLLSLMDKNNHKKVEEQRATGNRSIGTVFRRMRKSREGNKIQRAEVRFDGVSGCLRVPIGGSSKQILIFVDGRNTKTRLMTPRETARLMGLKDTFKLPMSDNSAFHLTGDGVVVPVVAFLKRRIFERVLSKDFVVERSLPAQPPLNPPRPTQQIHALDLSIPSRIAGGG